LEGFVSEARQEEQDSAAPSERPLRQRDHRTTRSERPPEPSGSSTPAASHVQSRPESDMTGIAPGAPEPQSTEPPRKATGTSERRSKPSRATAAATPSTNDTPAKPTIQWVDPPPVR